MDKVIVGIIILIVGLLGFAIYGEVQWQKWATVHCKKIGEISGSTGVGPVIGSAGNGGVGTIFIPGKTGYRCDDGMEYWR